MTFSCRLAAFAFGLLLSISSVNAQSQTKQAPAPCLKDALEHLRRTVPEGIAVHDQLTQKSVFTFFIKCGDDFQIGLTTAVHEGVHILTDELNAYPLIGGGTVPRVAESRALFRPGLVAPRFNRKSTYVTTYLMPGAATSAEQFGYLLDEFNAYTHDLNAAVKLRSISSKAYDVHHRDGLAALMAFVAAYVERARTDDAKTWSALQVSETRRSITALWAQAEQVMGASCRVPRYGQDAPDYLAPVCAANISHGLGSLLSRPPLCPVSCLRTTAQASVGR